MHAYKIFLITILHSVGLSHAGPASEANCAQPFLSKGVKGERSLNNKEWGYKLSTDIVLAGEKSQRFELRSGDCSEDSGWSDCKNNRERSEISVTSSKMYVGERKFLAWNIYLPDDFEASAFVNSTLGQVHQKGGPRGTAGGLSSFPPLMQFEAKGDAYSVCWHRLEGDAGNITDKCVAKTLAKITEMRGKWTEVVLDLDLSMETGGAKVYINGNETAVFDYPLVRFKPQELYMKYGIYNSFVSRHGGPMPTQVVYYDEIRIADKLEYVSRFVCNLKPLD
jgi:hypothetical protein